VPHGNSVEKNAAMRAFGAEIIEHSVDFDDAKQRAAEIAQERGYEFVPSFHPILVVGVATYARELFEANGDLDAVYAPIGWGSGICGLIRTRDLLGLRTDIVGVVSDRANSYQLSFEAGTVVPTNSAPTFADGVAVRVPDEHAFQVIRSGAAAIIEARMMRSHRQSAAITRTLITWPRAPARQLLPESRSIGSALEGARSGWFLAAATSTARGQLAYSEEVRPLLHSAVGHFWTEMLRCRRRSHPGTVDDSERVRPPFKRATTGRICGLATRDHRASEHIGKPPC
jgi:threonine dehydratase